MNFRSVSICVAVVLFAVAVGSAQSKLTMSGKCGKADVTQTVPAGDQQGHIFAISQGKCSVETKFGGDAAKEGVYAEHQDLTATQMKNWGVYTVTLHNGDKVYFNYQGTSTMKDGGFTGGTNRWQITGGSGKMQGIKGSGNCKLTGDNENLSYNCTGTYAMGGAAKPAASGEAKQ